MFCEGDYQHKGLCEKNTFEGHVVQQDGFVAKLQRWKSKDVILTPIFALDVIGIREHVLGIVSAVIEVILETLCS